VGRVRVLGQMRRKSGIQNGIVLWMTSRQRLANTDFDVPVSHANAGNSMPSEDSLDHRPARRQKRGSATIGRRLRRAMLMISILGLVYLVYSWVHVGEAARLEWQKEKVGKHAWYDSEPFETDFSPVYREYAMRRHGPYSDGFSD
jgi:hypothetical protein